MLTQRELSLLPSAIEFCNKYIQTEGRMPGVRGLRKHLRSSQPVAEHVLAHIKKQGSAPVAGGVPSVVAPSVEQNERKGDVWTITLPRTNIHTLEQLVEYCKIDLNEWEVERWVANKWDMGYIQHVTRTENAGEQTADNEGNEQSPNKEEAETETTPKITTIEKVSGAQPLYQVKAFLRRKRFASTEGYVLENARLRSRVEKLKFELTSEREMVKRLAFGHAGFDDLLVQFKELANTVGDLSLPVQKLEIHKPLIVPAVKTGHTEDAVLLLSDTHFGDEIRAEDTSGFPRFNLPIAGNRLGYIIQKVCQVLTLHRAMYPLKRLVVWFGGDMGNGELHGTQTSNSLFLPAQVHFTYHMLKFAMEQLIQLTVPDANGNRVVENIHMLFTVGNHMRMDEKMPMKIQAQRTLDWLIYQFVIERFTGTPNVTIRQEMSPYIFETIRGHKHLFAHGMQVGYRNSPDAQCKSMGSFIDRVRSLFDSPEFRRSNHMTGETFSRVCIGDIHVPVSFPRLISNGSLNGQNELGVNWMLEPIPAGQQLFGVADKHQETWRYFIECSGVQDEPAHMNAYGRFAKEYLARFAR